MLIDSGSLLNFLSEKLTNKLHLLISNKGKLKVMVANGGQMLCPGKCDHLKLKSGDIEVNTDFYILNLEGMDVILGMHWLQTLGQILWDFEELTIQIKLQD